MQAKKFRELFENKSNSELLEIVNNNIKYVLEARITALNLLKERGFDPNVIAQYNQTLQQETESHQQNNTTEPINKEALIEFLKPIHYTTNYPIDKYRSLHIAPFSKNMYLFSVQQRYHDVFNPIIIARTNKKQELKTYMCFNLYNLLLTALTVLFIYFSTNNLLITLQLGIILLAFNIVIQLIRANSVNRLIWNKLNKLTNNTPTNK